MLGFWSKTLLLPYWAILKLRNYLFDKEVIKSEKFLTPIISVGNITVGGTGKTPHVELIVSTLKSGYRVAVVSKGYKRKTKGFRYVNSNDDFTLCGDEPLQIKSKFPDVPVAVCSNRGSAICKIIKEFTPNFIILDDAFQYRKVIPSKNILLVDFNNTIIKDNLLPIGSLRDLPEQKRRADIVIVTKAPDFGSYDGYYNDNVAEEEVAKQEVMWREKLKLAPAQKLFFSTLLYMQPQPIFPQVANVRYIYSKFAVVFTGIANNSALMLRLSKQYSIVGAKSMSDHKKFTKADLRKVASMARRQPEAVILTTEKDAQRLRNNKYIPEEIKSKLFYLPVACKILPLGKNEEFFNILRGVIK